MRRALVTMITILMGLVVAPATAVADDDRVAAPAPCDAGWNCWWNDPGYSGLLVKWPGPGTPGTCTGGADRRIRSYAFYGGQEGYFYQSTDCTGPSRPALYNTESPDLGFIAHSFKAACVSCLAAANGGRS